MELAIESLAKKTQLMSVIEEFSFELNHLKWVCVVKK